MPLPFTSPDLGLLKITFSRVHRSPGTCSRSPSHSLYKSWQAASLHVDQSSELLIFLFSQKPDRPEGKQLVINPMGMFTVSSGMPMNPPRSIKGWSQILQDCCTKCSGSGFLYICIWRANVNSVFDSLALCQVGKQQPKTSSLIHNSPCLHPEILVQQIGSSTGSYWCRIAST